MSFAHRYLPHYSVEDYQHWQGDWELWQGIPVAMTPSPFGRHQQIATRLASALQISIDASDCQAVVLSEIDWIVAPDTVVRPDVVVVCGPAPARHVEHPPALVAEVLSPSTKIRDEGVKLELYAEHAVAYYLLLDPETNSLRAYELDANRQYQPIALADEWTLNLCDDCELRISIRYPFGG